MSDARKILDERLAKGEITGEEYDSLVSKISNNSEHPSPTLQPEIVKGIGGGFAVGLWKGLQGLGFLILVALAWIYFTGPSSRGLAVGNLKATPRVAIFTIANTSSRSGDVLIWIEKNGFKKCVSVFSMKANWKISNARLPCDIGAGKLEIVALWANSNKKLTSIAKRISF